MNQIMYKLDGFDDEWLPVGESPVVSYSNLWYGNYTFRVKASKVTEYGTKMKYL